MRFIRILIILIIGASFLFTTTLIYFNHRYPPRKINSLITAWAFQELGLSVQVGHSSFHLLKGFQLEDVKILPDSGTTPLYGRIKRVEFGYLWRSLFKGKIEIEQINLDSPILNIKAGLQSLPEKSPRTSKKPRSLPGQLILHKMAIQNGTLYYSDESHPNLPLFTLSKIDVEITNLRLPAERAGELLNQSSFTLRGRIHEGVLEFSLPLSSESATLDSQSTGLITFRTRCTGQFQGEKSREKEDSKMVSADSIAIHSWLRLSRIIGKIENKSGKINKFSFPDFFLRAGGWGAFPLNRGRFQLQMKMSDRFGFRVSGALESSPDHRGKLTIVSDSLRLDLGLLAGDLQPMALLPETIRNWLPVKGVIQFDSLRIITHGLGRDGDYQYQFQTRVEELNVFDRHSGVKVRGFQGKMTGAGSFRSGQGVRGNLLAEFTLDSLLKSTPSCPALLTEQAVITIGISNQNNLMPDSLFLQLRTGNFLGAELTADLNLSHLQGVSLRNLDFRYLQAHNDIKVQGIDLNRFVGSSVSGFADLEVQINCEPEESPALVLTLKTRELSTEFDTSEGWEWLPDLSADLQGEVLIAPVTREIRLDKAQFTVSDLISSKLTVGYSLPRKEINIYFEDCKIVLPLLETYFPAYLREEMISAVWEGEALINCEILAWHGEGGKVFSQLIGDVQIENERLDNPFWYLTLDSLSLYGIFAGGLEGWQLDMEGQIKDFQILETTPHFGNTRLISHLEVKEWDRIDLYDLTISQPEMCTKIEVEGSILNLKGEPKYFLSGRSNTRLHSMTSLLLNLNSRGHLATRFSLFSREENPAHVQIHGQMILDSVDVTTTGGIMVKNLHGRLPINLSYNLNQGELISQPLSRGQIQSFELFSTFQTYYGQSNTRYSLITADSISYQGYRGSEMELFIDMKNGNLFIPHLAMNLYDGNLWLKSWVHIHSGALSEISYRVEGQLARVNSSILPGVSQQKEEESRIGIVVNLSGTGLDFSRKIELEGELYVTEIGTRATENFLRSIDPYGLDPGVRSILKVLSLGYRPRAIAFEIRYGNFYPAIFFDQPWYSPVRIAGGGISISRLPLKFLLNLWAQEAKQGS